MVSLLGDSIQLSVYAIADPPLVSSEVEWRGPDGNVISPGSRVSLQSDNTHLVISSVQLGDGGLYVVSIIRMVSGVSTTVVFTNIDLNVQGERYVLQCIAEFRSIP